MSNHNPFGGTDPVSEAIRAAHKVRRLTKQEILNSIPQQALAQMIDRIGGDMWVVIDSKGRSVAKDPALNQPFHTNNRKFADSIAKELGGHAVTFNEALRILSERNRPND